MMRAALELLLSTTLVVTHIPVAVVSFCSTGAAQHQFHAQGPAPRAHAHTARASSAGTGTAAAPAADNTPTASAQPANDDSSSVGINSSSSSERFESFAKFLMDTQAAICLEAEASDGRASFCTDRWEREGAAKVGACRIGPFLFVLYLMFCCRCCRCCGCGRGCVESTRDSCHVVLVETAVGEPPRPYV